MTKPYDQDLRDKVIAFIERGNKAPLASKIFDISESTIRNWYKRYKEEGHCQVLQRKGKAPRLTKEELEKYIDENKNDDLSSIGSHFSMTASGALYHMRKNGLRYKKKSCAIVKPVLKSVQNI